MALTKGKEDLRRLAWEMGLVVAEDLWILVIKLLILSADGLEENSIKDLFTNMIEEQVEKSKLAEQVAEQERRKSKTDFELQKLKLQLEAQKSAVPHGNDIDISEQPKLELKKLIPRFNSKEDDMAIFPKLFERQLKFLKVPDSQWVAYLIGALPSDIATLISRESDYEAQDCACQENALERIQAVCGKIQIALSST
ncbi:transposon Tf2-6 polyprotein [Trichonephila clavipes]|nr:transposon Tf2-6 polyprotein [Trichonephila clavipes]